MAIHAPRMRAGSRHVRRRVYVPHMRNLTRREFNALIAAGVLAGCTTGAAQGSAMFAAGVATLPYSQFPALMGAGGSVVVDVPNRFPIVVVRTSDSEAIALSATCTHQSCLMAW